MTHNKFLSKYPNLWIPKIGDKVRVIQVLDSLGDIVTNPSEKGWSYNTNDIGFILKISTIVYDICLVKNNDIVTVYKQEVELCSNDSK